MNVYKKLQNARVKLQSIDMKKSGKNQTMKYFELGDFMPEINQIFSDVGLCGVISFGTELATLTIYCVEGNGSIEITSPMKEANLPRAHPIQNLGAVETYQRRYLWMTALEIVEHDALDSSIDLKPEPAKPAVKEKTADDYAAMLKATDDLDEMTKIWHTIPKPIQIKLQKVASAHKQKIVADKLALENVA